MQATKFYQECPKCNGTGLTERLLPQECEHCRRGFVEVEVYVEIVVEDGFARVRKNIGNVPVDIIDLDDDGVLDEESPIDAMKRLLDIYHPGWKHADWELYWHGIYGWQLDWFIVDDNPLDFNDALHDAFIEAVMDDVSLEDLYRNEISEVTNE